MLDEPPGREKNPANLAPKEDPVQRVHLRWEDFVHLGTSTFSLDDLRRAFYYSSAAKIENEDFSHSEI